MSPIQIDRLKPHLAEAIRIMRGEKPGSKVEAYEIIEEELLLLAQHTRTLEAMNLEMRERLDLLANINGRAGIEGRKYIKRAMRAEAEVIRMNSLWDELDSVFYQKRQLFGPIKHYRPRKKLKNVEATPQQP